MSVKPITAVCSNCRWLRETTNEAHRENYMACGWPVPPYPRALGFIYRGNVGEGGRWLTRKNLAEGWPDECGAFEPKAITLEE